MAPYKILLFVRKAIDTLFIFIQIKLVAFIPLLTGALLASSAQGILRLCRTEP